ncbi:Hypothetical predicted protein [Octopus vulgaris]|uniref:Uncharacterized protein n=1 Tax=Octopus vulgaris TaxID=6645 RepID=A0AA36FFE1_OCTVU|nr:Hypothetical predicted protein [Octopus vulgaris]
MEGGKLERECRREIDRHETKRKEEVYTGSNKGEKNNLCDVENRIAVFYGFQCKPLWELHPFTVKKDFEKK